MRWEKWSKPLEELGKWFLNVALAIFVATLVHPLFDQNKKIPLLGVIGVLVAIVSGVGLIFISEHLKKEE